MQKIKVHKNIVAVPLLALYLFVALFSQHFHNHGSGLYYKDFHFKNTENTIAKSSKFSGYEDCLSCHLFTEGNTVIPQITEFVFPNAIFFIPKNFCYKQKFSSFLQSSSFLRGPPSLV